MEVYSMQGHKGRTSKKEPKHWVFQTNYNGGRSYRTRITNRKLVVLVSLFRKGIDALQTWNMQIKREGKIKLMHARRKTYPEAPIGSCRFVDRDLIIWWKIIIQGMHLNLIRERKIQPTGKMTKSVNCQMIWIQVETWDMTARVMTVEHTKHHKTQYYLS